MSGPGTDEAAVGAARTIPELLARRARATPESAACAWRGPSGEWRLLSWAELAARVGRARRALQQLGLGRGERLAILAPTSLEWHVAELAALAAGTAVVGVDPHAPPAQAAHVLRHAGASGLLVERAEQWQRLGAPPGPRFVVQLAGDAGASGIIPAWSDLLEGARPSDEGESPVDADDLATLVYTAGTTGEPRGIGYSHAQVLLACRAIATAFPQIGPGDTTLCWLPMAHLFQRMMNLVAMLRGLTTYFVPDPRGVLEAAREVGPSAFVAVPRLYEKLYEGIREQVAQAPEWRRRLFEAAVAAGRARAEHLRRGETVPWGLRTRWRLLDRLVLRRVRAAVGGRIKFMITGTAPAPAWLLEFFEALGWLVLEAYGLSENVVPMAANRVEAYRFGSVGRPFPENEIRFADDGEVLVRGPGVFRGYWGEAATEALLTADGFYRTGDLGRLDADGFLYLVGRKAEIIKTSTGRRVAPAAVEAVCKQSPYVEQVVVVGDGRKHLVGLAWLNRAGVEAELRRRGLAASWDSPEARRLAADDLAARGEALPPAERVARFGFPEEPLSLAEGEMTPTLKLRRRRIAERHAALIEQLYRAGPEREGT